ncbi:MAG: hypothetical protein HKM87_05330 [Ignavibacteriaceae bacterium]|nr:hypothetical protein [Ignavibacteriaceae bacterium]
MLSTQFKYKRIISSLLLSCYLLVFGISIFHYHDFNFNQTEVFDNHISSDFNSQSSDFSRFDCRVHQIFNELHSYYSPVNVGSNFDFSLEQEYLPDETVNLLSSIYFKYTQLRAPPLV